MKKLTTSLLLAMLAVPLLFTTKTTSKAAENGTKPTITTSSNFVSVNDGWNKEPFTVSINGGSLETLSDDGTMAYQYRLSNDSKWTNLSSDELIWSEDEPRQTLYIRCYDTEDNKNYSPSASIEFQYDATAPSVKGSLSTTTLNKISISASDSTSGIAYYGISTDITREPEVWSQSSDVSYDEPATYYVWAKDNAGNVAYSSNPIKASVSLNLCNVQLEKTKYVYSGKENKPKVNVFYNGKKLSSKTDYNVSYSNVTNAGTGKVVVQGKGLYTGSTEKTITIKKATTSASFPNKIILTVGQEKLLNNSLKVGEGNLTFTTTNEKVVSLSNNKINAEKTGKATIVVKNAGNSNYTKFTKKIAIKVRPKAQKLNSVKSTKKNQIVVKWKENSSGVTGYKVYLSTNKKFTDKQTKVYTIKNKNTTTKTIKKLKAGKKYYVKVCAYKKSGKEYILSKGSTKSIKIKKTKKTKK